jgi:polyisoprenoid-binding protein YceI
MNVRSARSVLLALAFFLAACAAPSVESRATTPATSPPAAATSTAGAELRFEAAQDRSKVTVRVREQLASVPSPSDAVLTTKAVSGQFVLRSDGTFAPDSKLSVDVTTLQSDEGRRDQFIKRSTLETSRFPRAEFVPMRTAGLSTPMPATGEWTFTLIGNLTIRDVTKQVSWDATAKRTSGELSSTAKTSFKFGDFGMEPPTAASVLSVVDEIRMEIELVAVEKP